uniref:Uncharacterized protein n=1 Tax=Oryza punctata TaxID=4537 RepID=A0A0E0LIK0_ORYPU
MATSSPTRGSHLQADCLRHRRLPPAPPPGDVVPMQDGHFGLTPPSPLPMPPLSDFLPMQDGYFVTDWGLTPPSRLPTRLPSDIVPV